MSQDIITAILDAEQRRCAAMLANDTAALDALLDARLIFAHATGATDDKPAYMAKMAAGRIEYIAIAWDGSTVTTLGQGGAVLTGRMITDVRVEGVEKKLDNRVTSTWARDGETWRLVTFQSTPIK